MSGTIYKGSTISAKQKRVTIYSLSVTCMYNVLLCLIGRRLHKTQHPAQKSTKKGRIEKTEASIPPKEIPCTIRTSGVLYWSSTFGENTQTRTRLFSHAIYSFSPEMPKSQHMKDHSCSPVYTNLYGQCPAEPAKIHTINHSQCKLHQLAQLFS